MKTYPSIKHAPESGVKEKLHTFAKLDGSNLRMEWSKKRGWHKFGTRKRLLDTTDPIFGPAVPLFNEQLSEPLERIVQDQKWERCTVFCEYWGPESLAGMHKLGDAMNLTLFDVNVYKKGILAPVDFVRLFEEFGPTYLGYFKWGAEFIQQLRAGEIAEASFEGVVGKCGSGHKLQMYKTKTKAWIDLVKSRYGAKEAEKIINS